MCIFVLLTINRRRVINQSGSSTDIKKISQMLGHSNVVITEHYLAGLNPDITFGINNPMTESTSRRI